jgi:zinc protease
MRRGRRRARWALLLSGGVAACAAGPLPSVAERPGPPSAPGDETFRAQPPAPLPETAFRPPALDVTTLANGMKLVVVERHGLRLVAAELLLAGGSAGLPNEAPAALTLMGNCTSNATKGFSETQLFSAMNTHLLEVNAQAGDTWSGFWMRGPSQYLESGLQVMRAMALEPTFPPELFEKTRTQAVGFAGSDAENVDLIALRNLYAALFGPKHPYTLALASRKADLQRMTRDDVVRVWRETMDPSVATLVVVGDVDPREVRRLVEAEFGEWKHDAQFRPPVPAPPAAPGGPRLVVVDRPGARQAKVDYGAVSPATGSPDHATDRLVRALIGGMRSSALATELRDELGAAWREGVDFADRPNVELDYWYGSVVPERTAAVLTALDRRLRELRAHGPTPDELAAAKSAVVRSFPRRYETVNELLRTVLHAAAFGLPLDDASQVIASVGSASSEEVRAAVPDPDTVKVVVVGDLTVLKDSLLGLGWGAIELHDADGRLLRTLWVQ